MEVLRQVGFYVVWLPILICFYNVYRWLLYKIPTLLQHIPTVPGAVFSIALYEHNHQWFSSMYIFSSLFCLVFEVLIAACETTRLAHYVPRQVLVENLPFIFFVLSISVISLRSMRYEAMQGLCDTCYHTLTYPITPSNFLSLNFLPRINTHVHTLPSQVCMH